MMDLLIGILCVYLAIFNFALGKSNFEYSPLLGVFSIVAGLICCGGAWFSFWLAYLTLGG